METGDNLCPIRCAGVRRNGVRAEGPQPATIQRIYLFFGILPSRVFLDCWCTVVYCIRRPHTRNCKKKLITLYPTAVTVSQCHLVTSGFPSVHLGDEEVCPKDPTMTNCSARSGQTQLKPGWVLLLSRYAECFDPFFLLS